MTLAKDLDEFEGSEFVDTRAISRLACKVIDQQQVNGHEIPKGKKTAAIEFLRRQLLAEVIRQVMNARQMTLCLEASNGDITFQHLVELCKDALPAVSHETAVGWCQVVLTVISEHGKPGVTERNPGA